MIAKITFLIIIILMTSSCLKRTESITPIAQPTTMAEVQKDQLINAATEAGDAQLSDDSKSSVELSKQPGIFYLNIKYNMVDIDVFEAANMPNSFEKLGHSLLQSIAKLILASGGPLDVSIDDFNFQIPDMNIDHDIIKSIEIKKIYFQYNKEVDEASDFKANFSFINTLELSRQVNVPKVGPVDSLLVSYKKNKNACMFKCIQFDIIENNILDLIKPNTTIKLKPSLSITSLPAINTLKLDGEIQMRIGLKMPF